MESGVLRSGIAVFRSPLESLGDWGQIKNRVFTIAEVKKILDMQGLQSCSSVHIVVVHL